MSALPPIGPLTEPLKEHGAGMTELGTKLNVEVNHYRNLWRANYAAGAMFFFVALISSGLATLFAATGLILSYFPG